MKIIFTASKNPNFFSKLIAQFQGSEFTHCLIETNITIPGTNEPLVLHSSWSQGVVLVPKLEMTKGRKIFEVNCEHEIQWPHLRSFIRKYSGFLNYGWASYAAHLFKVINQPIPAWLAKKMDQQVNCATLLARYFAAINFTNKLDPNYSTPHDLIKLFKNIKSQETVK